MPDQSSPNYSLFVGNIVKNLAINCYYLTLIVTVAAFFFKSRPFETTGAFAPVEIKPYR